MTGVRKTGLEENGAEPISRFRSDRFEGFATCVVFLHVNGLYCAMHEVWSEILRLPDDYATCFFYVGRAGSTYRWALRLQC